jgi:hypothetical protein
MLAMNFDRDKAEEVVMALLALTSFEDQGIVRAWKRHDWDLLDGMFKRGWIQDPRGKAKSVVLTEQGRVRSQELFREHFGTG